MDETTLSWERLRALLFGGVKLEEGAGGESID